MNNLISANFYTGDTPSITLTGTGSDRLIIVIANSTAVGVQSFTDATINSVSAGFVQSIEFDGGAALNAGIAYWADSQHMGAGTFTLVGTWSGTTNDRCYLVLEYDNFNQSTPIDNAIIATVMDQLEPYDHSINVTGKSGKQALLLGLFADGGFTNASGFITSNDGFTRVGSDNFFGNVRVSAFDIPTIADDDETYTLKYSSRGTTAIEIDSMVNVVLAFNEPEANEAPTLDIPQPDVTIQEGQTGTIDLGANTSDPNTGDTAAYSITPDISLVTGFSFSTTTGVITYDGTQEAAAAVSYTYRRTDSGGLFVEDTFNLTVIVPALTVDSISDTTPQPGDTLTVDHSNALDDLTSPDYTVTGNSPGQTQVLIPDPTVHILTGQDYPTINFNTAVSIPLTDGTNSDTADLDGIEPPTGTSHAEITSIASGGFYANDVGVTTGMFGYVYDVVGTPYYDTATGAYALGDGDSFKYRIYNGEWSGSATVAEGSEPVASTNEIILRDVLRDVLSDVLKDIFED